LEEVFGFIDYHINNEFSLSQKWTLQELRDLKLNLTKVLHYIISSKTKQSDLFRTFWKKIKLARKEIGVITTNYDTLIDEAFDIIYSEYLIDYCIDLINFRYPDKITPFDWWINPKQPVTQFSAKRPIRTKLIKIHGSLNWKYCDCCGQVGLTPWQHRINLKTDSFESFFESDITTCPFDQNKLSSLIQVPTHLKTNTNFIFNKLYDEAGYTLRSAKTLVIVGYSFPEADVHIRAMIKRNFNPKSQIIVINKSSAKDLIYRYESLSKKVDYHEMTFERFIKSRLFMKIIENGRQQLSIVFGDSRICAEC
jgi:NAD-dependent SIR2 family protein deacetylase